MNNMGKDNAAKQILIVGGGLAGSFLAAECLKAGHVVHMIDDRSPQGASRIAAGMYNIITGKQAVLTWQARLLMKELNGFFQEEPFSVLARFQHNMPIYRPYNSPEDANEWSALSHDDGFSDLVQHVGEPQTATGINDPIGGLKIMPCGWIDINGLLDGLQELMQRHFPFTLHAQAFNHSDLDPETGDLKGIGTFDQVVFAEGTRNAANPWFNWIDIHPVKGQIIRIEVPGKSLDEVLMRKSFLIPKGAFTYDCGSTYEHNYESLEPTEDAVRLLMDNAESALKTKVQLKDARAGVRPTTRDRRPVMGVHPKHARLFILNGLGTKGLLQAPWCAKVMRSFLDNEIAAPPKEVGMQRFIKDFGVN